MHKEKELSGDKLGAVHTAKFFTRFHWVSFEEDSEYTIHIYREINKIKVQDWTHEQKPRKKKKIEKKENRTRITLQSSITWRYPEK